MVTDGGVRVSIKNYCVSCWPRMPLFVVSIVAKIVPSFVEKTKYGPGDFVASVCMRSTAVCSASAASTQRALFN